MPSAKIISYPSNYMDVLKKACSKPYGKEISDKSIQNIIKSGHLSVLEHCSISIDVSCSVRVMCQFTRHRHHSFTVRSARGQEFDTFIDPVTLNEYPLQYQVVGLPYYGALEDGMTLEQAAYYLPQGVKTSFVVTANARAWYEYLPKRLCLRAMPEHKKLAELIHEELKKAMPEIFNREMKNCKHCTERNCKFK